MQLHRQQQKQCLVLLLCIPLMLLSCFNSVKAIEHDVEKSDNLKSLMGDFDGDEVIFASSLAALALKNQEGDDALEPKEWQLMCTKLGDLLFEVGSYASAVGFYDESLKIKLNDAEVLNKKGDALVAQGKHGDALLVFIDSLDTNNIQIGEVFSYTNFAVGRLLIAAKEIDRGISFMKHALRADIHNLEVWKYLGNYHAMAGEVDKAIACYSNAVILEADNAFHRYNLAKLLVLRIENSRSEDNEDESSVFDVDDEGDKKENDTDEKDGKDDDKNVVRDDDNGSDEEYESVEDEEEDIDGEQDAKDSSIKKGKAKYVKLRNYNHDLYRDAAIYHYQQALEFQPDFSDAVLNLSNLFIRLNRISEAEEIIKKIVTFDPARKDKEDFRLYINLGSIMNLRHNVTEAIRVFEHVILLKPDSLEALVQLAAWSREIDDIDGALGYLMQATKVASHEKKALYSDSIEKLREIKASMVEHMKEEL